MIEPAATRMTAPRIDPVGTGDDSVVFACSHGPATRLFIPGPRPDDQVLADLLVAVHGARTGCRCAETQLHSFGPA